MPPPGQDIPINQQVDDSPQQEEKGECPICTLMREGGCEQQFHSFMDCGTDAEKGTREYADCIKAFEAMRGCMESNPAVFAPLLAPLGDDKEEGSRPKQQEKATS